MDQTTDILTYMSKLMFTFISVRDSKSDLRYFGVVKYWGGQAYLGPPPIILGGLCPHSSYEYAVGTQCCTGVGDSLVTLILLDLKTENLFYV